MTISHNHPSKENSNLCLKSESHSKFQIFGVMFLTFIDRCLQRFHQIPKSTFPSASLPPAGAHFLVIQPSAESLNHGSRFPLWWAYVQGFTHLAPRRKAFDRSNQLGKDSTAVYNGHWVITCVISTVRTGAGAKPDGPGASQVSQNFQHLNLKLGKSLWVENTVRAVTLTRGRIKF